MERKLASELFKHFPNIKEYWFTQGKICYDGIITMADGKTILFEIKVRDFGVDKYEEYFLQVDKFKNLANTAIANNSETIYYINFFKKDDPLMYDWIVFNITARIKECKETGTKLKTETIFMNECTFLNNVKVPKEVIMLKKEPKDMFGDLKIKL